MEIINFIKAYWREILEVIAILISIVICCIKKKPVKVVDTLKEVIVRLLPGVILLAEKTELKGDDKLKFALDQLQEILREMKYDADIISQYLPFAVDQVELILSTPQKKGVRHEE